jgi:hypothetical protein
MPNSRLTVVYPVTMMLSDLRMVASEEKISEIENSIENNIPLTDEQNDYILDRSFELADYFLTSGGIVPVITDATEDLSHLID